MTRKILFVLFAEDGCRQNHCFKHALDLDEAGHEVKIILEGRATACIRRLGDESPAFTALFDAAMTKKLVHGTCKAATGGCGHPDASVDGLQLARDRGLLLLDELDGHAGIRNFVDEGYELVFI